VRWEADRGNTRASDETQEPHRKQALL